ncbi:MAG: hypothetical protein MAG715_00283 [Methanonatronarchaeales archaeon]|nr:hypothetical protein [Methanonatronarchaeales archaeon]
MLCPRCGEEREHFAEKVCVDCFLERETLVEVDDGLRVVQCVSCGAVKANGWTDLELKDAVSLLVEGSASLPRELETPVLDVELERVLPKAIEARVTVEGDLGGRWVEESVPLSLEVSRGVCRSCSRSNRGYYEAVLQVRAEDRDVREDEFDEALEEVSGLADSVAEAGGEKPFVSRVERSGGGFDLYLGESSVARKISRRLKERFGAKATESASLVGVRDGREVYRSTHLVRLPPFGRGDVVRYRDDYFVVRGSGNVVELVDLETGRVKRVPSSRLAEEAGVVGDLQSAEEALLTMVGGDEVQVLDPGSMRAVTLSRPPFVDAGNQGSSVQVLKLEGELVPVNPEAAK